MFSAKVGIVVLFGCFGAVSRTLPWRDLTKCGCLALFVPLLSFWIKECLLEVFCVLSSLFTREFLLWASIVLKLCEFFWSGRWVVAGFVFVFKTLLSLDRWLGRTKGEMLMPTEAGEIKLLKFLLSFFSFTFDVSSSSESSVTLTGTTGISPSCWAYFSISSSFKDDLKDFPKLFVIFLFDFGEFDPLCSFWKVLLCGLVDCLGLIFFDDCLFLSELSFFLYYLLGLLTKLYLPGNDCNELLYILPFISLWDRVFWFVGFFFKWFFGLKEMTLVWMPYSTTFLFVLLVETILVLGLSGLRSMERISTGLYYGLDNLFSVDFLLVISSDDFLLEFNPCDLWEVCSLYMISWFFFLCYILFYSILFKFLIGLTGGTSTLW